MAEPAFDGWNEVLIQNADWRPLQDEIERRLRVHRFTERDMFSVKLTLQEALVKARRRGNQPIHVRYKVTPMRLDASVTDSVGGVVDIAHDNHA